MAKWSKNDAGGAPSLPPEPCKIIPPKESLVVGSRKFELPDLFDMFLGFTAKRTYVAFLTVYFFGFLWAYASVFAASAAGNIPLPGINNSEVCDISVNSSAGCAALYSVYLVILAIIVVPLTCLELKEQVCVQVSLNSHPLSTARHLIPFRTPPTSPDVHVCCENLRSFVDDFYCGS